MNAAKQTAAATLKPSKAQTEDNRLTLRFSNREVIKALKVQAIKRGRSASSIVEELVTSWLKKSSH